MRVAVLLLTIVFTAVAHAAHDDCRSLDPAFPEDVAQFKQQRCLCHHFSGEPGYDEERRQFLAEQVRDTCSGLEELSRKLRLKYADQPDMLNVLEVLSGE